MPRFEPGHLKAGGRRKGTPNLRTTVLADLFEDLGVVVPREIIRLLPKLSPQERADVLLRLMEYLYPKRKALEHHESGKVARERDLEKLSMEELNARMRDLVKRWHDDSASES
jgi:hypothetical protein